MVIVILETFLDFVEICIFLSDLWDLFTCLRERAVRKRGSEYAGTRDKSSSKEEEDGVGLVWTKEEEERAHLKQKLAEGQEECETPNKYLLNKSWLF